jgi:hypothetical protein
MTDAQIADSLLATPVLDHTAAIQNWLGRLSFGDTLTIPSGRFRFNTPLTLPLSSNMRIKGAGRQKSLFSYFGSSTSVDLWTVGDGVTPLTGIDFSGFNIDSETTMTGGTALRLRKIVSGNNIFNVSFGRLNTVRRLWDAIWFDNTNVVKYVGFEINCQNELIVVSGDASLDSASDLELDKGTGVGGKVGIHCAGGFGGLYVGAVLMYGQEQTCYLQDNSRAARANREVVLSSQCVLDGANGRLLHINETVGSNTIVDIDAFITGAGFFSASPGEGIYIQSAPIGRISIGSKQVKGNKSHGIRVDDSTCNVLISSETFLTDNLGWGLYSPVPLTLVRFLGQALYNTAGNIHPNVRDWIPYTPFLGSSGGPSPVGTSSMRYRKLGSSVQLTITTTITSNNGGSGALIIFLPFNVMESVCFSAVERGVSGASMQAFCEAGTNSLVVLTVGNTYPAVNGAVFIITGFCEVA